MRVYVQRTVKYDHKGALAVAQAPGYYNLPEDVACNALQCGDALPCDEAGEKIEPVKVDEEPEPFLSLEDFLAADDNLSDLSGVDNNG